MSSSMRQLGWLMLLLLGAAVLAPGERACAADAVRELVVRVIVTQRSPNHFQPWTKAASQEASGSES